jgi:hypothetical protein
MSSYEDRRLAELAARISEIDLAIAGLNIEYDNTAVRFNGDPEILKQAASIEEKIAWLRRERNLAEAATKQAEIGAKREVEARELEGRCARTAAARELASAIVTIDHELDDALLALRELFERRHAMLRDLQVTNVANTVATKLMSRGVATRAACFAGIDAHLDLARCAPGSRLPLASGDPLLRGIGKEQAPQEDGGGGPVAGPVQLESAEPIPVNGSGSVEGET